MGIQTGSTTNNIWVKLFDITAKRGADRTLFSIPDLVLMSDLVSQHHAWFYLNLQFWLISFLRADPPCFEPSPEVKAISISSLSPAPSAQLVCFFPCRARAQIKAFDLWFCSGVLSLATSLQMIKFGIYKWMYKRQCTHEGSFPITYLDLQCQSRKYPREHLAMKDLCNMILQSKKSI